MSPYNSTVTLPSDATNLESDLIRSPPSFINRADEWTPHFLNAALSVLDSANVSSSYKRLALTPQ